MSQAQVETTSYPTTIYEQHSSPVTFETINTNDVFLTKQQPFNSEFNMYESNHENAYTTANLGAFQQNFSPLTLSKRSTSMNTIDHLMDHSTQQNVQTDISQYPIYQDPNPEHVRRGNTDHVTYRQDVAIRYLQPPTPSPAGPVIIREIRAPQPPEAPPLVIRQRPIVPATPPPMVIRERPPTPPIVEPARVINKYLPAPPPPARKVIIERQAPMPKKPQPVIIEKWLPYPAAPERQVIVEHAPPVPERHTQRNKIITWDAPRVDLVKNVRHLGTVRVDPRVYASQYGSQLATHDYVLNTMQRFGLDNHYGQMIQMPNRSRRSSASANEAMSSLQINDYYSHHGQQGVQLLGTEAHRQAESTVVNLGETKIAQPTVLTT